MCSVLCLQYSSEDCENINILKSNACNVTLRYSSYPKITGTLYNGYILTLFNKNCKTQNAFIRHISLKAAEEKISAKVKFHIRLFFDYFYMKISIRRKDIIKQKKPEQQASKKNNIYSFLALSTAIISSGVFPDALTASKSFSKLLCF
jgi:hypothetical protein